MEYTTLGRTGRRVSRIGFGGATAGIRNYVHPYDPENPDDRQPIVEAIRAAYASGINYFDTAAGYGDGVSERIFGEGLRGIDPAAVFLASKVAPAPPDKVRASLERSLANLQREYIDLIQIHGSCYRAEQADRVLAKGGVLDTLMAAKDEGLVRHVGFSIECQNEALYRFLATDCFDVVQIEYNLLFQHPYDPFFKSGSLYDLEERGVGIAAMRTATSGIFQKWVKLVNPGDTFNYNPALIQFVLSSPFVDVALLGMRSAARVAENVAICDDLSGRIDIEELHVRVAEPGADRE